MKEFFVYFGTGILAFVAIGVIAFLGGFLLHFVIDQPLGCCVGIFVIGCLVIALITCIGEMLND